MKNRYMNKLAPLHDKLEGSPQHTHTISMSEANYKKCTGSKWFKYGDDGKPRLKTKSELELEAESKAKADGKKDAQEIRDEALRECTVELNGNVYQARESDMPRMQVVISELEEGELDEWIMKNDVPTLVTREEMITALSLGIVEVRKIWKTYKEALKAL